MPLGNPYINAVNPVPPTEPAGEGFSPQKLVDPMYKMRLFNESGTINLEANLPERYALNLGSSWDTPYNQPISSHLQRTRIQRIGSGVGGIVGLTTRNKWLSAAFWTQGSSLEISMQFNLIAETDAKKEVVEPMKKLMEMVSPGETTGGFLTTPGPTLLSSAGIIGGEVITVQLGHFFELTPVVIRSVNEEFDTQFDANGDPISVVITVNVMSFFTVTKETVNNLFKSLGI